VLLSNVEDQVTNDQSVLLALVAGGLLLGCRRLGCCSLGLLKFFSGDGGRRVFLFGSRMGLLLFDFILLDLAVPVGPFFDLDWRLGNLLDHQQQSIIIIDNIIAPSHLPPIAIPN
jgi:hypothetical protein